MSTFSLRCRLKKCRHRRVSRVHPDDAKQRYRCPKCRGMHGWRIENRDYNKRNLCNCSGVEVIRGVRFPHRPHNPYCDNNPWAEFNRAALQGIPGGHLLGWRADRRTLDKPVLINRRKRPCLDWSTGFDLGTRMSPDDPCPF